MKRASLPGAGRRAIEAVRLGVERGVTYLELIAVAAIVGILAAAILPLARVSVTRQREIELRRAGYFDTIGAGVVFTGGSSQLRGLAELAEAKLGIPARVGFPLGYNGMADLIAN